MKAVFNRLRRLTGQGGHQVRLPLMICGLDYEHYRIQALIARSQRHEVLALISDFPWNHGTYVGGTRVYYPSEAPSLARRHGVAAIVYYWDADLDIFDADTTTALADLHVPFVRLDPDSADNINTLLLTNL